MRKSESWVRRSLDTELIDASERVESGDRSPDAVYRLRATLREHAAGDDPADHDTVHAQALLVLARADAAARRKRQSEDGYARFVAGMRWHGVLPEPVDLDNIRTFGSWWTLLAATSRSPRRTLYGVEDGSRTLALLGRLGHDPLASGSVTPRSDGLSAYAYVALDLIDVGRELRTGAVSQRSAAPQRGVRSDWHRAQQDLVAAHQVDDRALFLDAVRRMSLLARTSPAVIADIALALCARAALAIDPLAGDVSLGAALIALGSRGTGALGLTELVSGTYSGPAGETRTSRRVGASAAPESAAPEIVAPVVGVTELVVLLTARRHLVHGRRPLCVESLAGGGVFGPHAAAVREVLRLHARVGDRSVTDPSSLLDELRLCIARYGARSALVGSLREAVVLLHLRRGEVMHARAELDLWRRSGISAARRGSMRVLGTITHRFEQASAISGTHAREHVDGVGWSAQESFVRGAGTAVEKATQRFGGLHPTVVVARLARLERLWERGEALAFAQSAGALADDMIEAGFRCYRTVFELRVRQGDRLLHLGHGAHAVRVLSYASDRLDSGVPEAVALRTRARLLQTQARLAVRDLEGALAALGGLAAEHRWSGVAAYFEAVARHGLGDLSGASDALARAQADHEVGLDEYGLSVGSLARRSAALVAASTGRSRARRHA